MKSKDYAIIALFPLGVLVIPLVAMQFTAEVNWTLADFAVMWVILSVPTFLFRLLVTQPRANLSFKVGAGVAVLTSFLMTWVNLAVQIIGDHNPANLLYFGVILLGLAGVGLSKLRPAGLARTAFTAAGVTFLIPVVAWLAWPADFQPGILPVFLGNGVLTAFFVVAGLLFCHAARNRETSVGEPGPVFPGTPP